MDLTDEPRAALEPLVGAMPRRADGRGRPWRSGRAARGVAPDGVSPSRTPTRARTLRACELPVANTAACPYRQTRRRVE